MANIIPFAEAGTPEFIKNRKASNTTFLEGLPKGGFQTIGCNGTRFVTKVDGVASFIKREGKVQSEISLILLSAKSTLDRTYYIGKYDPNSTETKAPDCQSSNGVTPDTQSPVKQAESCAGCPQNQWGSGEDAAGNPSKGKACQETKMLAVFANNGVYGFKIMPSSIKNFRQYVKEAEQHGIDLTAAITVVGFDPNFTYPVYTFGFGGYLTEGQIKKCDEFKTSPAVLDIIGGSARAQLPPSAIMTQLAQEEKKAEVKAPPANPFDDAEPPQPAEEKKKRKPREVKPAQEAETVDDEDLTALVAELWPDGDAPL